MSWETLNGWEGSLMFRLRDLLPAPYQIRKDRLGESAVHDKQGALCEQGASLVEMALSASGPVRPAVRHHRDMHGALCL